MNLFVIIHEDEKKNSALTLPAGYALATYRQYAQRVHNKPPEYPSLARRHSWNFIAIPT